jgi:AcrR family transcriptional regulator
VARKPADQSVSREAILAAAAEVLQKRGYEAATMKDIAAAVNLTAASLYHHFPSKDALLLAVLEQGMTQVLERADEVLRAPHLSNADKLRALICEHIIGITGNTAVGAAMVFEIRSLMAVKPPAPTASADEHAAWQAYIARRNAFFEQRDRFEKSIRRAVQDGIAAGEFRPVDAGIFTKTLLGAQNWVGLWFQPHGRLTGAAIADMMADTFLASLRP